MIPSPDSLGVLVGRQVVLDTAGPVIYLGTLEQVRADGFWLRDADLSDRREGHATKESYVHDARREGISPNRRRVFVFAHVVMSVSALEDVVAD